MEILTELTVENIWLRCKYNALCKESTTSRLANYKFGELGGLAYIPQDR